MRQPGEDLRAYRERLLRRPWFPRALRGLLGEPWWRQRWRIWRVLLSWWAAGVVASLLVISFDPSDETRGAACGIIPMVFAIGPLYWLIFTDRPRR